MGTVTVQWLHPVYVLKAQLTGFVKGLDGDVREKVKVASKISGRMELPSAEMGKIIG